MILSMEVKRPYLFLIIILSSFFLFVLSICLYIKDISSYYIKQIVYQKLGQEIHFEITKLNFNEIEVKNISLGNSKISEFKADLNFGSSKSMFLNKLIIKLDHLDIDEFIEKSGWNKVKTEKIEFQNLNDEANIQELNFSELCKEIKNFESDIQLSSIKLQNQIIPMQFNFAHIKNLTSIKLIIDHKSSPIYSNYSSFMNCIDSGIEIVNNKSQIRVKELNFENLKIKSFNLNIQDSSIQFYNNFKFSGQLISDFNSEVLYNNNSYSLKANKMIFGSSDSNKDKESQSLQITLNNLEAASSKNIVLLDKIKLESNLKNWQENINLDFTDFKILNEKFKTIIGPISVQSKHQLKKENLLSQINLFNGDNQIFKDINFLLDLKMKLFKLKLPKTNFNSSKAATTNIFPVIKSSLKNMEGQWSLKFNYNSKNKYQMPLELTAKNINIDMGDLKLNGLSWNHSSKNAKAQLKIDNFILAKELSEIEINYEIPSLEKIKIKESKFKYQNANFTISPFTILPMEEKIEDFEIKVEKFSVDSFLKLIYSDGVFATGDLSGQIPLHQEDKFIIAQNGFLKSNQKGKIKLRPTGSTAPSNKVIPSNPQEILKGYLYNFDYEELSAKINTKSNFDLILNLKVYGRNPEYLSGKPLKLSVNFELNILKMIQSVLITSDVPEFVKKKLIKEKK